MKNRILFFGAIVLAMVFGSCTKDDFDLGSGRYGVGEAINFGAYIDYGHDTRTSYGELKDGYYPVYWEDNDKVHIFSPQASIGTKDADGKVTITQEGNAAANYTVSGVGNTDVETHPMSGGLAMAWGESDVHDFYTFYPVSKVYPEQTVKESAFVATVPREQTVTVSKTETVTEGDVTYNVTRMVDMQSAIMAGHKQVKRSEGGKITLPFKPLTTAVDIVIDAPTFESGTTPTYNTVTITSIQIANAADEVTNRKGITGGFKVFPSTDEKGEITFSCSDYTPSSSVAEDVQSTFLNIDFGANGHTMTCVNADEKERDRLIVTGFLLPYDLPDELRVIVHCKENVNSGASNFISKTIKVSDKNTTVAAQAGKKFTIKLGAIKTPIEFNYSTWMANLPDDTYVSQISMPGSHDAGTYDPSSSIFQLDQAGQTQFLSIYEQLSSGIRCIDFRPSCKYDLTTDTYTFGIAHGFIDFGKVTFDGVLADAVKWLAEHPTEFVILKLKNESSGSSNMEQTGTILGFIPTYRTEENFTLWQKTIIEKINAVNTNYIIKDFNPYMTLKEARGKILFMSRDHYLSSRTGTEEDGTGTHWVGCKISGWGEDNPKMMTDKTFYTQSYPKTTGGTGGFSVSDYYRGDTDILTNAPSESAKKAAIDTFLTACRDNTCGKKDYGEWYFTYLNVRGSSRYTSTYNQYVATKLSAAPYTDSYKNVGVIMIDWVAKQIEDTGTDSQEDPYAGFEVIKAVVDNNFKGDGPAKKTN